MRKVDSKGRIYLSPSFRGKRVYLVRGRGFLVVAASRAELQEVLKKLYGRSFLEEYLSLLRELGEPTLEELEKSTRRRSWRKLEEYS